MVRTRNAAPDPKPTPKEMLDAIEAMTWQELLALEGKVVTLVERRRKEKNRERYEKYGNF